jgi:hypothetical protein
LRRLRFIPGLIFAVALLPYATAQAPQQTGTATQTILRIEDQWLHARTAQEAARFRPAPQPPASAVHFEHLTVSFPAPAVAIATGEVIGTGSDGRRIYVVAFSDTFCLRHGRWLAVHAQETLEHFPCQC